jgi:hypothetical protein
MRLHRRDSQGFRSGTREGDSKVGKIERAILKDRESDVKGNDNELMYQKNIESEYIVYSYVAGGHKSSQGGGWRGLEGVMRVYIRPFGIDF